MKKEAVRFSIPYIQFLDREGDMAAETPSDLLENRDRLLHWYRTMVLARVFDAKAINLQKTDRMGTYAPSEGQEAIGTGVASAMEDTDVLLSTYREHVAQMVRAETPEKAMTNIFLCWGGDERGHMRVGKGREDFPMCIPIATQAGHAAGVGMAFKIRKEKRVAVCMLGDGASSKGDVHEAMSWSALWLLPVVFVISNNQYAISQPRKRQAGSETLAQIGIGSGVRFCVQVDGNDVTAVYDAMRTALRRAREGQGPTVIEAITYRLGNHTTADDASRYRASEEVARAREHDPILRLRTHLEHLQLWGEADEAALEAECKARVESAIEAYLNIVEHTPQATSDMFRFLHAELPQALIEQMETAAHFAPKEGRHGH